MLILTYPLLIFWISFLAFLTFGDIECYFSYYSKYLDWVYFLVGYGLQTYYYILSYSPPTQNSDPWGSSGFTTGFFGDLFCEVFEWIEVLKCLTD